MTTKKLIVEVEIQNHPDLKKQMDEIVQQMQGISEKHEEIAKLTSENAAAAVKAYEELSKGAENRNDALSGEAAAQESVATAQNQTTAATQEQTAAEKALADQQRERQAAMTELITSGRALVGQSTKMLRSFALLTAANEEDAQAMIKRIAQFEGIIQGIQGVTGALAEGRKAWIAYNRLMSVAGGSIGPMRGGLGFGIGRVPSMVGGIATAGAGMAAMGGAYAAYSGLRSGGGQGIGGTITAGLGGVSMNQGGVSSVGDLDATTGAWGGYNPLSWGGSQLGIAYQREQREKEVQQGMGAEQKKKEDLWGRQDAYYEQQGSGRARMMRLASPEKRYELREQRRGELTSQYEEQAKRVDTSKPGGALEAQDIALKQLDLVIQAEEDKYNKELDNKKKLIEKTVKEGQEIEKNLRNLSKIHSAQMSGRDRFNQLDKMEQAQVIKSLDRFKEGSAEAPTMEDVRRTEGMRVGEDAERQAETLKSQEAAKGGYFEAIGTNLNDVLARMKEIGNLEIALKTSNETVVKLEGEWNQLAKSVGEKVSAAVQGQYQKIMESIDGHMQMNATKIGQYHAKAPSAQQQATYDKNTAPESYPQEGPEDTGLSNADMIAANAAREKRNAAMPGGAPSTKGTAGYKNKPIPASATGAQAQQSAIDKDFRGGTAADSDELDKRFHKK